MAMTNHRSRPSLTLSAIKSVHTIIWGFFVLMIGAIWVFAFRANFTGAAWSIAIVSIEVAILGLNHGQCPLRRVAARYSDNPATASDIYLPLWLAARTKPIFGSLYVGGILFTALRWATTTGTTGS
jgi:hypothetical protein